jgi:2-keto-4-pentenoate hydratase/2-oxohepta-3-ene-1,7-dioic acid hydratase in catechol pathway
MKIICIGRNYVDHIKELGNAIPSEPVLFMKPKSALNVGGQSFRYPEFTNELHYECELVLKICKNGKYINEFFANEYYDQITVGIDFTARDIQNQLKEKGLPWEKAKAFDDAAVIGTWKPLESIVNKKEIPFSLQLNGNIVQNANSSLMIYSFNKILADASKYFTLNIGDLIFTGTPAGVGECVAGDQLKACIADECLLDFTIR